VGRQSVTTCIKLIAAGDVECQDVVIWPIWTYGSQVCSRYTNRHFTVNIGSVLMYG